MANSKKASEETLEELHATLDQATKPLAELMMDKATEALLKQRGLI